MASNKIYASVTTTAGNVTLTGAGKWIKVTNITGAGILFIRNDGVAASAAATEDQWVVAAQKDATIYIPVNPTATSTVLSIDASVATTCFLQLVDRIY